jgi:two-component system, NarL family, sensor kinase
MTGTENRNRREVVLALARFALAGLLAVVVVGALGVAVQRKAAREDAIDDAKLTARLAGRGIVEANVTPALLRGDPDAISHMDEVVRERISAGDGIERVKLWTGDGRVVYSDNPALIGKRFPLDEDDREALENGTVAAEETELTREENELDGLEGRMLEVYMPISGPDGKPMLFELYQRQSAVATDAKETWLAFAPGMIGALILLQLLQLPLAYRMARNLQDGRREREGLLEKALDASDSERRRIAGDLHDGVVQDLVGTSYALAAAADRVNGHAGPEVSQALRHGASQTRRSIRQLRSLLVDIYPPDLHKAGLAAALSDLVAPLESRGVQAHVQLPPTLVLERDAEALMFRTAQEALRNVMAHSKATRVDVSVSVDGRNAGLDITDDGCGFSPERAQEAREDGHFGLRVLSDMAQHAGGRLSIDSAPGAGTRVLLEVPVA